ncbi:hypothetical protein ET475_12220 [Microbacterium protaetiae]|uniref:CobQ/CobB/MinD/ParA nucleotide binding domain-containing protein n=1 Tax=Microbacterium protaetiae TaxID=2509458 RepID=A0A4P6ENG5_9MICO|nr:P-loop NTPase [Microbacterium protaetiae]QAY61847.1 hypothetical protein ET475_12220 [Microbacterium protaetiae]
MRAVIVATSHSRALAAELERAGVEIVGALGADHPAAGAADPLLDSADALVLEIGARTLTVEVVAACDRAGVRIVPLCATEAAVRLSAAFGLAPALPFDSDAWTIAQVLASAPPPVLEADTVRSQVITVWGPAGAPGRSTLAVELAAELSRGRRRVGLVDADTHAPALALMLGLTDEGPGFAAACRQAERGALDAAELDRISTAVPVADGAVAVLSGINRPSRWPELSDGRVTAALQRCRDWVEFTVVDAASSLERDEEIVSDLADGPRRNAATLAALRAADRIVAVLAADPVGVARFLRAYGELRAVVGNTPVAVVANRLRPGTLGIDARGQVQRTLERFAGISDVWFIPNDARGVDKALLASRPVVEASPRSSVTPAVRRFAAEAVAPAPTPPRSSPRRLRRRARVRVAESAVAP